MHPDERQLALWAGGDLGVMDRWRISRHVQNCDLCETIVESFYAARFKLREEMGDLPKGLNWERLAGEMTGNIRVGVAAGECISPVIARHERLGWRAAAGLACATLLITTAWWLNIPLNIPRVAHPSGVELEATQAGVELKQNGGALLLNTRAEKGAVTFSRSAPGSIGTRYVDSETGQVTINNVYAQ